MKVDIEYCGVCNYRPQAASLAMAIEKATGIRPGLIHSREMGAFEVRADGELVYSKKKSGVFPEPDAVIEEIRKIAGQQQG